MSAAEPPRSHRAPRVHVVLMGLRGSGKSTVSRALAQLVGLPALDLDDATARALGHTSVGAAWAAMGEPAFRAAEAAQLRSTLAMPPQVLALGGGTPTAPGAADLLRAAARDGTAVIVYLSAPPAVLRARLAAASMTDRPSLTGASPLDEIEAVYARRDPIYRGLATHIVDASMQVDAIAAHIARRLGA